MRKFKVPILTEEYKVVVYLGTKNELIKAASKYIRRPVEDVEDFFQNHRGCAINELYNGRHPLILINTELPVEVGIPTVAHEASHAMDYIEEYLGIKDKSGEIHAHGIAAIMRYTMKDLKGVLKKFSKTL